MSSLRETLQDVLLKTQGQFIDDKLTNVEIRQQAIDFILTALQTAVLAASPEKIDPLIVGKHQVSDSYNHAIDQYTKALQQLFESEG